MSSAGQPTTGVTSVFVLAAGAGTRMRSALPKVLHPLAGRPLLGHALVAAAGLGPDEVVAVIGHGRDQVSDYLATAHPSVRVVVQEQQLGTGHAVACALGSGPPPAGTVVVTYGDTPLLTAQTLRLLVDAHQGAGAAVTVLTADVIDPSGYGRIVRDADGRVASIVEEKDADAGQQAITEINSGVYAFDGAVLAGALPRLSSGNTAGEVYLTDVVALARQDGQRVEGMRCADPMQTQGVNDRVQLAELARELNGRLIRSLQLGGVTVSDPATTWVHADVTVGPDSLLLPGTSLEAGTTVGSGCRIGPDTTLSGCTVADGATVVRSQADRAVIGENAQVGPFTYLRPGAQLLAGAKTGAYVEVKGSTIGLGAKVPHLSYVGDTIVGAGANVGAGTITANYDGEHKYPTVIGEQAFIGSNVTLVAPVTIGDGSFVAAGSTVVEDVGPGDLAVARGRQRSIAGWIARKRPGSKAARAAAQATRDSASGEPS